MELQFTGNITEIKKVRTGETAKGEWANAEFEVTESNPQNENYPQIALFDYFKNGEYLDHAKKFEEKFSVGDEVTVSFNMKKNTYTKDGEERSFYKTSAWKVEKIGGANQGPGDQEFEPADDINDEDYTDLPF